MKPPAPLPPDKAAARAQLAERRKRQLEALRRLAPRGAGPSIRVRRIVA